MSRAYDEFKNKTIEAQNIITKAKDMRALSDDFSDGFNKAMWEAREIFMILEDDYTIEPIGTQAHGDDTEN